MVADKVSSAFSSSVAVAISFLNPSLESSRRGRNFFMRKLVASQFVCFHCTMVEDYVLSLSSWASL